MTGAPVKTFKTYEDYLAGTGEVYNDYDGYSHSLGTVTLTFHKDGKKHKIKCSEIWGFVYDNNLLRIDQRYNQPIRVLINGKICYYENGIAHLSIIPTTMIKRPWDIRWS